MKSLERKTLANQFHDQIEAILADNGFGTRSVFDYNDLCGLMAAAILAERERIASDLFNRNGFMTAESGDGHFVKISFKTMDEMHEFHRALVSLSQFKREA